MRIRFQTPFYAPPDHSRFTSRRVNFDRVNEAGRSNAYSVLKAFLPDGKQEGPEWVATNPTRPDKRKGSFKVNMASFKWADFAISGAAGGDPVSLVAYIAGLPQREAAIRLAESMGVNPYE